VRERHIVYYHHVVKGKMKLGETTLHGYSPAHVAYLVNERMRKKGFENYGVDGSMTIARERALNSVHFDEL